MLTEGRLNTTAIWRKLRKIIESKNITLALTLYYLPKAVANCEYISIYIIILWHK